MTPVPVTAVAHLCGSSSASAFIDVFRRAFGHTPGTHPAIRPGPVAGCARGGGDGATAGGETLRVRLFVAVLPPEAAVDELAAEVDGLRMLPGADGLRWTERAGWHFTLAFLGEVPEDVLPALDSRLAWAAGRAAPFPLDLRGGGSFGDRALWAGAGGDHGSLRRLAERVETAAREAGVDERDDRHGFRPHLTLARAAGRGTRLAPFVEALGPFRGSGWTVARLSLVRSRLPRRGVRGERPRYEEVGHWALGGDG